MFSMTQVLAISSSPELYYSIYSMKNSVTGLSIQCDDNDDDDYDDDGNDDGDN